MVNWDDYNYGQEICLRILNDGVVDELVVKMIEYGWHAHGRIKITSIVEIIKSDNVSKWPVSAKIEFPIKTDGEISFIMLEHKESIPRHKTIMKGEIVGLCNLN